MRKFAWAAIVAGLLTSATAASADTIVDTGPGQPDAAILVNSYQWVAGQFTVTQATTITGIRGYLDTRNSATPGNLTIRVRANLDGVPDMAGDLFNYTFSMDAREPAAWRGVEDGAMSLALEAGSYWVALEENDLLHPQYFAGDGLFVDHPMEHYAVAHAPFDAFGNLTGLPTAYEAFDFYSFAFQIFGHETPIDPGPGVPEPRSWALAILGFGLAGAALRRRRALISVC